MNTIELLDRISEIACNRPDTLKNLNWNEISDCIIAEINCLREFYPSPRYEELMAKIKALADSSGKAARFNDHFTMQKNIAELTGITEGLPAANDCSAYSQQAAFDHAALDHFRNNTAVVIGDSHVNFFSGNENINYEAIGNDIFLCPRVNGLNLTALYFGSCLAYTCLDPDSTTGFQRKLSYLKKNFLRPDAKLIISLGEIDIRLHVYKQAEKQKRAYTEIIDDILRNYRQLIHSLISEGYSVFCWGPIGSQKDTVPEDPAVPRYGNEAARNTATRYFNKVLSGICAEEGAVFISIFEYLIEEDLMTREKYLSPDKFHIGQKAMEVAIPVFKNAGLI